MSSEPSRSELHDPVTGYWVRFARDGDNLIIDTRVEPGGGPPPHVHPGGDEVFTISEGTVRFLIGRRKVMAGPGDELVVPRGTRHAFKNVGTSVAAFRAVVRPELTGKGEAFFRETADAAAQGMYTRRGIPTGVRAAAHMMGILERYQDFVLISNPPPALQRILFPLARRLRR